MIQKVQLQNFRNLNNQFFEFSDKITVIIGPNGIGKTNLLESIFILSVGKSFKVLHEIELINETKDFARIKGLINEDIKLEVIVEKNKYKKLLLNGVSKRLIDFTGNLKVVLFSPRDLDLVTNSPTIRRKFLDTVLSLTDKEYHRSILSYEKGLRQRNKLLFRIREQNLPRSQLLFWNQLLIKNADYIAIKREELINFINNYEDSNYNLTYDKSTISEERLNQYASAEIASATTLVGPHRDDFIFNFNNKNLASYGSRGEQRMGILWLKLAELQYVEKISGEKPTLLLDDIFSELDEKHREMVFDISHNQQTIITTADPEFIKDFKIDNKIELGI